MTELIEQIQAAEAAALQVAELEAVKATADQLPALRRQLADRNWIEQAEPAAEQAEQQARQILGNVTPAMVQWRERLEALYADIHTHIAELPELQAEISAAARYAQQAATLRQGIEQRSGSGVEVNNDFPEFGVNGFWEVWRTVGGHDIDLQVLPHFPVEQRLRVQRLVEWALQRPFVFYDPKKAGR